MEESNHPVILFDGVCNLCSSSVQLIIKHDRKKVFRYASLQSEYGKKTLEKYQLNTKNIDSIVVIDGASAQIKSSAVLSILKKLGGIYSALYVFIIIPKFLRDSLYDFVARNRYRWFGKQESCMLPTPERKKLFIDSE